jgi:glycosyltransferase involved in cell wall biosynthesis
MPELAPYSVLVVIPAYNVAAQLSTLLDRVRQYVCNDNLLVVNDGSTDETREILRREVVTFLDFRHNRGKGEALRAAFRFAVDNNYRSVLTLDADLQHEPAEIPGFFARDDGRSLVLGVRAMSGREMPPQRKLSNFLTSIIVSIFSTARVRDSQSGYRLIPTDLLKRVELTAADYDLESELLFKAGALGYPIKEVAITTIYRDESSYIRPVSDTLRFIRLMWRRVWL